MAKLTLKQSKFVDAYLANGDKVSACIFAGFSEKSAPAISCQLLKNPKIIAKITEGKLKKNLEQKTSRANQFDKAEFVDKALECFDSLEITESNKPRFLELAGKACNIIGTEKESKIVNQSLTINNVDIKAVANDPNALLDMVRKMIADNSGVNWT